MTTERPSRHLSDGDPPAELRAEHDLAKQELAETLHELRHRTDVTGRSKAAAHRYAQRSRATGVPPPVLGAVAAVAVAAAVAYAVSRACRS
ncbi:DUF3618 domain-containing protein [Saccharopolyspora cebuensis]|uniref:DUF3618 domain-containing protein n=1 Tax=Saccharopolyspora cebuensis TaxID=418759 RepID=A0ABV4CFX6_9PSEU